MVNLFSDSPFRTKKLGEILGKEIFKNRVPLCGTKVKKSAKKSFSSSVSSSTRRTKPSSPKKTKRALILGLEGDLGGGKTTFLQGFAKGLGIKEKILSPTFIILKKFKIPEKKIQKQKFENFYHIDCYRLQKSKEILFLGFKEIISNPKNIVAIEWADRIRKILPKDALILRFKFVDQNRREIKVSSVFPFAEFLVMVK